MRDSNIPPPQTHAGRRRIAARSLADATGIGSEIARRSTTVYSGSSIPA
jgi:hypothetical protein